MLSTFVTAQDANKVAVYVTGKDDAINKMVGDKLVDAFVKDGKYIAVERTAAFLSELKKEQKYQMSGEVSDSEISELGKQFGVQYVCVVDIYEVYYYYNNPDVPEQHISARLINVESVEIVNSANTDECLQVSRKNLERACETLAKQLTQKTPKQIAEENAAKEFEKRAALDSIRKIYAPEDNNIKGQLDKGYFIVEDLYVIIASDFTRFSKKEAQSEAEKSRLDIRGWRLPTSLEFRKIKNYISKHRDEEKFPKSYYFFNSFTDYDLSEVNWWIEKYTNSGSRYKYLMLVSNISK